MDNLTFVLDIAQVVTAIAAILGIGLGLVAVFISRQSTRLARRSYLDAIYDKLSDSMDDFDVTSLPYASETASIQRLSKNDFEAIDPESPNDRYRQTYSAFHRGILGVLSSIARIRVSGLVDAGDRKLGDALTTLEAAMWAKYFFTLTHSKAEAARFIEGNKAGMAQSWEGAWVEVSRNLQDHSELSDDLVLIARGHAEKAYSLTVGPDEAPRMVGRWQLAEAVLVGSKSSFASEYKAVADQRAAWK